jgi:hypothetical protein
MQSSLQEPGTCTVEVSRGKGWVVVSRTGTLQQAMVQAREINKLDKEQPLRVVSHQQGGAQRIYTMVAIEQEKIRYVGGLTPAAAVARKMSAIVGLGLSAAAIGLIATAIGSIIAGFNFRIPF